MKTAIMQPYFFPYVGYYQMLAAVDTFIILDDVNFIKRGWINRNNILLNGSTYRFTIPLDQPSQNKLISETRLNFSLKSKTKFLRTIQTAYRKAPEFDSFYEVLERIIMFDEVDLTSFLHNSFNEICDFLKISTKIVRSSEVPKDNSLKAQDRIIELCKKVGTGTYINLPGGKGLYNKVDFKRAGLELKFIQAQFDTIHYKQFDLEFTPYLSFIDILMFNNKEETKNILSKYEM